MALFGKSKDEDSKAKIEELKNKIKLQASGMAAPSQQAAQPQPQAPDPQPQQPPAQPAHQQPKQSKEVIIPLEEDNLQAAAPDPIQKPKMQVPEPHSISDDIVDDDGIIVDVGNGISLNLPIRQTMELKEFLEVAERVKKLKGIDENHENLPKFG